MDVEEHRCLGGNIFSRLDNGASAGLIYYLLVLTYYRNILQSSTIIYISSTGM